MRIAICPGSFDPVTKGHLNIIERSAKLFDAVTVLVMVNPNKTPSFTAQERADFLRRVTGHIPNVKVDVYTGPAGRICPQCRRLHHHQGPARRNGF